MTTDAQRGYVHAALKRGTLKPAAEEEGESPAAGGAFCAACGGRVDAKGYAEGGAVRAPAEEAEGTPEPSSEFESKKAGFLAALQKGK